MAFDATGKRRWRTAIGSSKFLTWGAAAVAGGRVVFPSTAGKLVALDAKTGLLQWQVPFPATDSAPAIANNVVYVGSPDKSVYAFEARTGKQLWSAPTGGAITSSPTVVDETLYVGSDDGVIRAYRLRR